MADYMLKVKAVLTRTDPALSQAVWDYFVKDVPGKPISQQLEDVLVEELVIGRLAKQGEADQDQDRECHRLLDQTARPAERRCTMI